MDKKFTNLSENANDVLNTSVMEIAYENFLSRDEESILEDLASHSLEYFLADVEDWSEFDNLSEEEIEEIREEIEDNSEELLESCEKAFFNNLFNRCEENDINTEEEAIEMLSEIYTFDAENDNGIIDYIVNMLRSNEIID